MAHELVVEAQRVVAQRAGLRARHQFVDAGEGFGLTDAFGQRVLRSDAGDECGDGRGQQVIGRFDVEADRLVDHLQLRIGAHGGELRDAGAARVLAEGFQVIKKEAFGHQCAPSRTGSCSWMIFSNAAQSIHSSVLCPAVASARMRCCRRVRSSATAYGVCRKVTIV